MLSDVAAEAFATLFVVIYPIGLPPLFLAITDGVDERSRAIMAFKGTLIGGVILVAFALWGDVFLATVGITLPAFRIAGGVMLFITALEMVFDRRTSRRNTLADKVSEDEAVEDVSVFPLAIPFLAGPGAITSIMLLMGDQQGNPAGQMAVLAVLAGIMLLVLVLLLVAGQLGRFLGATITNVFSRLLGVLLAALASQFILDGLKATLFAA